MAACCPEVGRRRVRKLPRGYIMSDMPQPWRIEPLEEVKEWRKNLSIAHKAKVDYYVDLLAEEGEQLRYPYSSGLGEKLRELRVQYAKERVRVSYYAAKRRRMVLLTVFRKQQRREKDEIARARGAVVAEVE